MFCQCVHAPGLLKSCHMLSSSSFPKSVTPLSFHSPPLSLSLSLHPISLPLWQDRLLLSDKHSFSISAEKNQVAVSYTSLSLSLSGMWHVQFLYTWHCWYSFSLFFSISPSHSIYLSVSQPCLTFPALIGRGKFYRAWRLVWQVRTYRYT